MKNLCGFGGARVEGWKGGRVEGWKDGRMEVCMHGCCFLTCVPSKGVCRKASDAHRYLKEPVVGMVGNTAPRLSWGAQWCQNVQRNARNCVGCSYSIK